tara:strand:+ start:327 stop:1670 length:1344 start_codon:yes stop_codon:yes gene_type:complete
MTVSTTWAFNFVDASGSTDFTSRVLSFQINQEVQIGQITTFSGTMTMDNSDNALTPAAGGTYQNFAWFEKVVKITCAVNDGATTSTAEVGHFIVADLHFNDDGVQSTVRFRLLDPFTFAGRDTVEEIDVSVAYGYLNEVTEQLINGTTGFGSVSAVAFPKFGATNATVSAVNEKNNRPSEAGTTAGYWGIIDEFEAGTAKDHLNFQILPAGPSIVYPTVAEYDSGTAKWTLNAAYVNRLLTKGTVSSTDHFRTFEFTETDTADKFVFRDISVQFNNDQVINEAIVQANAPVTGEGPTTRFNTDSQEKLGIRSVNYDKVIVFSFGGATVADKGFIGSFWVNRYNDANFTPQELFVSVEAMAQNIDSSSRQLFADLLDMRTGLWNLAKISYTPTGAGSSLTYKCVIVARTITGTPTETRIRYRLNCAEDNQSFELDQTDIGLLDNNRLG